MQLKDIDLNLLKVFNQLHIQGRVFKVAEELDITQPAVSNALSRLRALLGDELFLRTPKGMAPTPYAEQLAGPVAAALEILESAVNQRATFEPSTSDRAFTIGMTDIGEIYFLPTLMRALSRQAKGISISTVRDTSSSLKEDMEAGKVDLAVGLLPQLTSGFFQRRLLKQKYVCLMRKAHRLSQTPMTLTDYVAADHVVISSPETGHGHMEEVLERTGIQRRVCLELPHFVAVGHILQTTDLIATVPEAFAEKIAQPFELVYVDHPAVLPDITINLFWHGKVTRDPASQWLRNLFIELFSIH